MRDSILILYLTGYTFLIMAEKKTESETSLYRKYRPQAFSAVRGQEHIVSVLEAAVANDKVGHAYLFSGPRGTGKTSTARIFAQAVGTDPKDLYELDAASNNGVEDIRSILDGVSTHPFASKFKVYIIDEVHMLSKAAFNACLKTLEEPPPFVIFILATTELYKVPETVRSRCQTFEFKKPSRAALKTLATDIAKEEGATLAPGGAELVAMLGDGSYRDTLSILQKVLTVSSDKKLSEDEVAKVVGAPKGESVNAFLTALSGKNIEEALSVFHTCVKSGVEASLFLMLGISRIRGVLLLRYGGAKAKQSVIEQFGEEDTARLEALAGKDGAAINSAVLAECITAYLEMGRAPIPELPLELALYRLFTERQ